MIRRSTDEGWEIPLPRTGGAPMRTGRDYAGTEAACQRIGHSAYWLFCLLASPGHASWMPVHELEGRHEVKGRQQVKGWQSEACARHRLSSA